MSDAGLARALRTSRVLVCAGTGGVGKTTIAASLALEAALLGRRTLVLTIDPARRLADALGLPEIGTKPEAVDLSDASDAPRAASPLGAAERDGPGPPAADDGRPGSLHAMMLDPKPTFDRLVTRFTEDEAARARILDNRIYRHLTEALAGSAEYAAMEQVHDMVDGDAYDLIVVDTPPADHALDFLRAPRRLRAFFESRFVRTLVHPALSAGRFGARLFGRAVQRVLKLLERVAGVGFLDDLAEFLVAIDSLSQGFRERAERVERLLLGPETGFVLISGPQSRAVRSGLEFLAELDRFEVHMAGVVANRLRRWPLAAAPADFARESAGPALGRDRQRIAEALADLDRDAPLAPATPELDAAGSVAASDPAAPSAAAADEIVQAFRDHARGCAAERQAIQRLEAEAERRGIACLRVPELAGDVDRLTGLRAIGAHLVDASSADADGSPG